MIKTLVKVFRQYRSLLQRTLRIVVVITVIVLTIIIGELFGPKPVSAKVYQVIYRAAQSGADILQLNQRPAGKRQFVLNGQPLDGEIAYSQQRPTEIIDQLERYARQQDRSIENDAGLDADGPMNAELAKVLTNPFRVDGQGWSVFGRLTSGPLDANFIERIADRRGLGVSAKSGFLVLAQRAQGDEYTSVWTLRFPSDFDPLQALPALQGDTAGSDLSDVDRYPGAQRVYSFSERSAVSNAYMVAYLGGGSVQDHMHHYRGELGRAGFVERRQLTGSSGSKVLTFDGKDGELDISITNATGTTGKILDVIQVRYSGGKN